MCPDSPYRRYSQFARQVILWSGQRAAAFQLLYPAAHVDLGDLAPFVDAFHSGPRLAVVARSADKTQKAHSKQKANLILSFCGTSDMFGFL